MIKIFKSPIYFTILFSVFLLMDILVKLNLGISIYRYFSKPLVMISLLGYFYFNSKNQNNNKNKFVLIGIVFFLIGDILFINHLNSTLFFAVLILFVIGKLSYSLRFTNTDDFKLSRLLPFLIVCFLYMLFLFNLINDKLNDYFIPVLAYFFLSLIMALMAYLRKKTVNKSSYYYVLIGMAFFILSESTMALKTFYRGIPLQDIIVMLFYGISQYLIIIGILKENINFETIDDKILKSLKSKGKRIN